MLKYGNTFVKFGGTYLTGWDCAPPPPSFDEVTIGTQTWMAKNLDISDGGSGITIVNNVAANGVNMGTQCYYTWDAAVRVANTIQGWHLPTKEEWEILETYVGGTSVAGTKLKSTNGWNNGNNGTDDYGFTILPVGSRYNGQPLSLGGSTWLWTSTENESNEVYLVYFGTGSSISISNGVKNNLFSIRLIKD